MLRIRYHLKEVEMGVEAQERLKIEMFRPGGDYLGTLLVTQQS